MGPAEILPEWLRMDTPFVLVQPPICFQPTMRPLKLQLGQATASAIHHASAAETLNSKKCMDTWNS